MKNVELRLMIKTDSLTENV